MKINQALIHQGTFHEKTQLSSMTRKNELLNSSDLAGQAVVAKRMHLQEYQSRLYAITQSVIEYQDHSQFLMQQDEHHEQVQSYTEQEVKVETWRSPQANDNESEGMNDVLHTQLYKVYDSSERLIFESVGEVKTEDGRTIDFMMQLDFANTFHQESTGEIFQNAQDWVDPLVISLTGQVPTIAEGSFEFDLNSDGQPEHLKQLGAGLGYIAFDKNGDGKITSGNELFGATSGQGFSELAQYDSDGNGWIDENDSIYHQLKVWQPANQDQPERLISFSEAQVGAIFLHASDTQYTFNDENNNAQARITQGSAALMESGKATYVFQMEWAMPLAAGEHALTFELARESVGVIITEGSVLTSNPQVNAFTQTPLSQTIFRTANITSNFSSSSSTRSNNHPESDILNSSTASLKKRETELDSVVQLPTTLELLEKEDTKILELRAMIDVLKDIREGNFIQMKLLQKYLIDGD